MCLEDLDAPAINVKIPKIFLFKRKRIDGGF
jgi:hypothetical protein